MTDLTTEQMLHQTQALIQVIHQRLGEIEATQKRIEAQLRATDWVNAATLAQQLDKPPNWPRHWRSQGIFTTDNGCVRRVEAGRKPRYEYHLGRCCEQWEWWSKLPAEGRAAFLGNDGEVA